MGSEPDLRRVGLNMRLPPHLQGLPGIQPHIMPPPMPRYPLHNLNRNRTTISTHIPKPANYVNNKNFSRFCDRFRQYIALSNIRGDNLHYVLLGMVDDITYAKLEKVELEDREKRDPVLFCRRYERVIYPPGESKALRSELAMIKQGADETIETFAFRISEIAAKAYTLDIPMRHEASYTAFIQGIYGTSIKTKILESEVDNFSDAVQLAERLERVAKSLNTPDVNSVSTTIFAINGSNPNTNSRTEEVSDLPQQRRLVPSNNRSNDSDPASSRLPTERGANFDRNQQRYRPSRPVGNNYNNYNVRPQYNTRFESQGNNNRGNTYRRSMPLRCYYCGREGHFMRSCYRLSEDSNTGSSLQDLIHARPNNRQGFDNHLNEQRAGPGNSSGNPQEARRM